jgi:hypothetical protein
MARCAFAIWTPIAATTQQVDPYDKTQVILHTIVGSARATIEGWQRRNTLESTFVVALDGTIFQTMDSASRADANRNANRSAISIETEDHGVGRDGEWDPDRVWVPWTEAQLQAIVRLLEWAHRTHDIPLQRCASPTAPGVGYHSMWGTPSPWTPVVKSCPGPARIRQFDTSIRAFLAGDPMPDGAEIQGYTQRPIASLPVELRQRLVVDERWPGAPTSRRSTRRAAAGRPR